MNKLCVPSWVSVLIVGMTKQTPANYSRPYEHVELTYERLRIGPVEKTLAIYNVCSGLWMLRLLRANSEANATMP